MLADELRDAHETIKTAYGSASLLVQLAADDPNVWMSHGELWFRHAGRVIAFDSESKAKLTHDVKIAFYQARGDEDAIAFGEYEPTWHEVALHGIDYVNLLLRMLCLGADVPRFVEIMPKVFAKKQSPEWRLVRAKMECEYRSAHAAAISNAKSTPRLWESSELATPNEESELPSWDGSSTLSFRGRKILVLDQPAKATAMKKLFGAFENKGWPRRVEELLGTTNRRKTFNDANTRIETYCRKHYCDLPTLIRFGGDGHQGATWGAVE